MNAHGLNGMYASGTPRVTAGPGAWASTDTGRDKPVPYEPLRHPTVGATLVVARLRANGFVEPGRDKPVPYGLLRHLTVGATLVVARARRSVSRCGMGQALPQAPVRP